MINHEIFMNALDRARLKMETLNLYDPKALRDTADYVACKEAEANIAKRYLESRHEKV